MQRLSQRRDIALYRVCSESPFSEARVTTNMTTSDFIRVRDRKLTGAGGASSELEAWR